MPLTEDEEIRVMDALGEGLGVEDIAVRFGWRADAIRAFVFSLPSDLRAEICRPEA
ncbi:MAG TPA: hypothetical protein PKE59_00310 [Novosphingobium sp.]|jgi:hypothetical protein|nr:hypothetical protein [Novosphingobium sp.]